MSAGFEGRHVVVTGGAGALGQAVVEVFADAGATCHVPVRRDQVPAALRGRKLVRVATGVDLADEADVESFYRALPSLWASVHAAGGFGMGPIATLSLADFEAQWRLNAVTCFLSCREAIRVMRGSGGGRIVNVAARPAVAPVGGMTGYVAAKAAVAAMTQALAREVVDDGILVNAVLPSTIDTPDNRAAMPDADFGAWPTPAEIARAVVFLAAPDNSLTHGALVPVYGRA